MSLRPISQSPIPSDLKEKLFTPQTPWAISQALFKRITEQPLPPINGSKNANLISSDPEHAFVLRYFLQTNLLGIASLMSIASITALILKPSKLS